MLRLNIGFLPIRDENRAKFKISYSCGHRVSKSARSDASIRKNALVQFLETAGYLPGFNCWFIKGH